MKISRKTNLLLPCALGFGVLGLVLRWLLKTVAVDSQGLLLRGHGLTWAVCLVPVAALVVLGQLLRGLDGANGYAQNFQPSLPAALGALTSAAACLWTAVTAVGEDSTTLLWKLLGYAACVVLLVWAWCRYRGRTVPTVCGLVVCLFFLAQLVAHYRGWSADPQVMDYLFDLVATMFLMLFSYYCAAFSAGIGSRRMQLLTGLGAVCLCLIALVDSRWPWLYVGGGCMAATNLCRLTPVPKEVPHADS